jgi:uncharacterized protein (TIGR02301 family)
MPLTLGPASAQFLDFLFGPRPEAKPPPAAGNPAEVKPGGGQTRAGKGKRHKVKPASADKTRAEKGAPAKAEEALPPYDPELLRLAEILGALTYLDGLCTAKPTADWRAKMQALLEAEAKTNARKERLAGSYNRGFRDYERSYHFCTPNAQAAIGRFLAEGSKIAHEVVSRYGTS